MESASPLFRKEAIENRVNRSLGSTRINVPMNFHIAGYGALGILVMFFLFVSYAQLSEKTYIRGYLDTEKGIISVESKFQGMVKEVTVEEGMSVQKGDVLYIITNPKQDNTVQQANNLKQRINNLKREYQLKEKNHHALKKLCNKHFIALSTLIESESSLLEIKNKLKGAEYELLNFKDNQYQLITAPISGIITNIFYQQGQSVQSSKPLVQIIPNHTDLVVRLYIPAREIGFVNLGQTINLKYDAYPSQRFGFYQATIIEINQTILTDDKEDKPIKIGEPYYKIMAKLKTSYVNVYGRKATLSHGLTLTAIVTGEKKKIWQWIFDPINGFRDALI